jgi:hypothetical protein
MTTFAPSPPAFERPAGARDLLAARYGEVRFLDVPDARVLAVDGSGEPGSEGFRAAFAALYPVAYTLHFALKRRGIAAPVGALEGLFTFGSDAEATGGDAEGSGGDTAATGSDGGSAEESGGAASAGDAEPGAAGAAPAGGTDPSGTPTNLAPRWQWRLMLPVPAEATDDDIAAAIAEVRRKKAPPALDLLRVERWTEGPSAQTLHVGPYDAEPPTIAFLHQGIAAAGLRPRGLHHELYVSDPNRTAVARLKTVIRQPVEVIP